MISGRRSDYTIGMSCAIAAGMLGLADHARAQAASDRALEEIVVTATKRAERLQDVPISISVFDDVKLEQLRPTSLADLVEYVPNMYMPPANESQTQYISLRGLGPGVTRSGGRAVGIYIDGAFSSADNLANLPISDIASIEVLRGPQGTLYGRDTIGGAVNVTTKRPSDTLGGYAELEAGNYGRVGIRGGLDVPLVEDKLFFRLSGTKLDSDGYIDNVFNGEKTGGIDQLNTRAQLYFEPNDRWDARLVYTYLERDDNTTTGENGVGTFSDDIPYLVNINEEERFEQDASSVTLSVNYNFANDYTLSLIAGWADSSDVSFVDRDVTPEPVSTQSILYDVEDFTQELRLTSPANDKYDFLIGIYHLQSDWSNRDTYPLFGAAWLANIGFPPLLPDTLDGQEREVSTNSLAVFTHGNYYVNDKLSLFGGLRYTSDEKEVSTIVFGEIFAAFGFQSSPGVVTRKDEPVTWAAGMRYAFSDAVNTYVSISRGYRSAAVKDDFITAGDLAADGGFVTSPEYLVNYEIGTKIRSADGAASLNAAVFYMDYTDIQVAVAIPPLTFVQQLQNAAAAHIQGFELDGTYNLTDNLRISASAGYLETEYDEFTPAPGDDRAGTGFGGVPEWTLSAAVDYFVPLTPTMDLELHLDGTKLTTPDDFAPALVVNTIEGHSMLNGSIALVSSTQKWRLTLWGRNLLDDDDVLNTTLWGAGLGPNEHRVFVYQQPRTYGATLRYSFD